MINKTIELIKYNCTGCCACMNACPKEAISMIMDSNGFIYPAIDNSKCNKCGICLKICPVQNKPEINQNNKKTIYAAWSLNTDTRYNSTSGGIFSELAAQIINEGGCVVGARYNDKFLVEHCMISKQDEIKKIRQSKYTQSTIGFTFKQIKEKLNSEIPVLFCGCPCQVAGLKTYLGKDYDYLYIADFICRGVNSPKAYRKYLDMLEYKYNSKITKVWFKNKTYGWNRFSTRVNFENGKYYIGDRYHDLFMRGYLEFNLYMRDSCYNCNFKGEHHISDITLADFWGVGNIDPKLDENKGTSMIMVNSNKGNELVHKISQKIFMQSGNVDDVAKGNLCLMISPIKNPLRDKFLSDLDKIRFDKCLRKYAGFNRYYYGPIYINIVILISNILKIVKRKLQSIS